MVLLKIERYFNTVILAFQNTYHVFSAECYGEILPFIHSLLPSCLNSTACIWFTWDSKVAPAFDWRRILECQWGRTRVSMEHPREISTDKPDDIIFPLKVLQNPRSYCVLQILSDPSKLNLLSSSPLTPTTASAAFWQVLEQHCSWFEFVVENILLEWLWKS